MEEKKLHERPDFAQFISELAHGDFNNRMTDEMAAVVEAVEGTGLLGELTVTFKIKKEGTVAVVACEMKKKMPHHPFVGSMFYFGTNGELLSEDPRQMTLRKLDKPTMRSVKGDE